ncbi:MAG: NUDIX domain-containing protein [Planctomycetota bacterium]|jgi:putative (di)nucleoside polyphosphate hydrolase
MKEEQEEPAMNAKDILIADLEHFGESMWRNEEVGEKRFSFFVTLVTAVAAGLVALLTSEEPTAHDYVRTTAAAAIAGLLVVGMLSYLRMLQRNRVTDEYQRTLRYIRGRYREACPELKSYRVPVRSTKPWVQKYLRGGYAETVGTINGVLLFGLLWALKAPLAVAIPSGLALVVVLWACAAKRSKGGGRNLRGRYFRAGVGAVIADDQGKVLTLERSDVPGAWQLPQGGIEEGEAPLAAVLREIREETGIAEDELELAGEYPEPLVYELPPEARSAKTGMGQVQYWFRFRYRRRDEDKRLPKGGEFRAGSWRPLDRVASEAVEFRRRVYQRLAQHFGTQSNEP